MKDYRIDTILEGLFWLALATAFWGAFEFSCQAAIHPIWSGTWGYPYPHHYILGFAGIILERFIRFMINRREKHELDNRH